MKKVLFLIVSIVILGLVFAGCDEIMKVSAPTMKTECLNSLSRTNGISDYCVDFNVIDPGDSVEGLNTVDPLLNIQGKEDNNIVSIMEEELPTVYGAPNNNLIYNNGVDEVKGGFSDLTAHDNATVPYFSFTFAPGISVSEFSVRMLDFGDLNPSENVNHYVRMRAYNSDGDTVDEQILEYTSDGNRWPGNSPEWDDLRITGDAITAEQGEPGNWTWTVSGDGIVEIELFFGEGFDPCIALDTLCFTVEPTEVPLDIKPTSCPNPLNTKSNGVIPVAILGTADFDVTLIDPDTVLLEGITPLRWAYEDVATPFEPYTGKTECDNDCNTLGPDGYEDLTLKFDAQELLGAIGAVMTEVSEEQLTEEMLKDGDCVPLYLTASLFDGTLITGEDVVRILKKGK